MDISSINREADGGVSYNLDDPFGSCISSIPRIYIGMDSTQQNTMNMDCYKNKVYLEKDNQVSVCWNVRSESVGFADTFPTVGEILTHKNLDKRNIN